MRDPPWLSLERLGKWDRFAKDAPSDWGKSLLSPQNKILFPKPIVKTFHNLVSTYFTSTIPQSRISWTGEMKSTFFTEQL